VLKYDVKFEYKTAQFADSRPLPNKLKLASFLARVREELEHVEHVLITHFFSPATTGLCETENVKKIYTIQIKTRSDRIPFKLLRAIDRRTKPKTIFEVENEKGFTYFMALKDGVKFKSEYFSSRSTTEWVFTSDFTFDSMEDLYGTLMARVLGLKKQPRETAEDLVARRRG